MPEVETAFYSPANSQSAMVRFPPAADILKVRSRDGGAHRQSARDPEAAPPSTGSIAALFRVLRHSGYRRRHDHASLRPAARRL